MSFISLFFIEQSQEFRKLTQETFKTCLCQALLSTLYKAHIIVSLPKLLLVSDFAQERALTMSRHKKFTYLITF